MKHNQPVNKRKIFWVIAIVAVAAVYQLAHPFVERQFNVELPSLMEDDNVATLEEPKRDWKESDWEIPNANKNQPLIGEKSGSVGSGESVSTSSVRNSGQPFLTPTGKKNRLRSPAGLIYGENHGEHRVDHVMRHGKNDPSRPVHSVFDGNKDEILRMIDEAYEQVKSNSSRVKKTPDKRLNFRAKFVVDMNRKVGYLGGKRGKRENFPPRSKIALVLDNDKFVITAYPDR